MPTDTLFLDSQHPSSERFAVFEDDGTSAWLYLTECGTRKPIADTWVHNRIPAPAASEIKNYRGGPPPAANEYIHDGSLCETPSNSDWQFLWATDGNSVALSKDGQPVAFANTESKSGWSTNLIKSGPWGCIWDSALFDQLFNETA